MRRPLTPAAARAGRLGLTAAALLAIALSAGGCVTGGDGRMNAMAQSGSGATLAFDSIDGPPPQVFERFVEALNTEAQGKALPIASRQGASTYRVRAYLAAQVNRGRTAIAWVFDVYDANQQRTLRLSGEEPAGKTGRDAWTVADASLLRKIAQNGMNGIAALMNGTLPAEAAPPAPGPAAPAPASGPAIAASEPAAEPDITTGGTERRALAFRAE
jgi:hypothetical protein